MQNPSPLPREPRLLLAVDAPSLLHRNHHARAESALRDHGGRPAWALHGMLRQILEVIDQFAELISRYPNSEYVPEAMFYTAQAYTAERNLDAADAQYLALISRFPSSPRVPTAMYKRALHLQADKKTAEAKKLFQDIIKRFPRSDEAALADERLQSIR